MIAIPERRALGAEGSERPTHVQKILGLSQITTTAEYAKVYAGALKKVIEKKYPREKLYRMKKWSYAQEEKDLHYRNPI